MVPEGGAGWACRDENFECKDPTTDAVEVFLFAGQSNVVGSYNASQCLQLLNTYPFAKNLSSERTTNVWLRALESVLKYK